MKKVVLIICTLMFLITAFGCESNKQNNKLPEHASAIYATFEDLIYLSTDVVKAKCISVVEENYNLKYEFQVLERYVGEETEQNIYVYIPQNRIVSIIDGPSGEDIGYETSQLVYTADESYYLVLSRRKSVYDSNDHYLEVGGNLYIPVSDISKSTLYGQPLTNHSNIEACNSEQQIIDHIVNQLKVNPNEERLLFEGQQYIVSEDFETIIDESPYILKVKLKEIEYKSETRATYKCTVISTLKGDCAEGAEISIPFFPDTVREGKEYIVALMYSSADLYVLSSKNSVFSKWKENNIVKHLKTQA